MFAALRRLASLWATVKSESVDEIKESIEEERQSSSFKFSSEERKVGKKSKFIKPETVAAKVSKKIKVEKKNAPKTSKKSTEKVKKEEVEEEVEDTESKLVKIAGISFRTSNCDKAIEVRGCEGRSDDFEQAHCAGN